MIENFSNIYSYIIFKSIKNNKLINYKQFIKENYFIDKFFTASFCFI